MSSSDSILTFPKRKNGKDHTITLKKKTMNKIVIHFQNMPDHTIY